MVSRPVCLFVLPIVCLVHRTGLSEPADRVDHETLAKAAERAFHAACDEWSAAHAKGESTSSAATNIRRSYHEFLKHIRKTKYTPNAALLVPDQLAGAGKLQRRDGSEWSYVVGGGQSGLVMSVWKRDDWHDRLPPQGFADTLALQPELRAEFAVGVASWADSERQDILRVPYTLKDVSGVVEIRRLGDHWHMRPDRGIVEPGRRWQPFAATCSPGVDSRVANNPSPHSREFAEQLQADQHRFTIRQVSLFHRHFVDSCMNVLPENLVLDYRGIVATDNGRRSSWVETTQIVVGSPLRWGVVDPERFVVFQVAITTKATAFTIAKCSMEGREVFVNVDFVTKNRGVDDQLTELGGRSVREVVSNIEQPGPKPGIILPEIEQPPDR